MDRDKLPQRAEAGVVIGGYELVRRIGRGGMAEVWVARRALGKKGSKFVAIKLLADHYVGDDRYTRMFRAESELAAVLTHANIVQVFDEGEEGQRSYLIMEWVDGLNLLKLGAVLALVDDDDRRFRVTAYIIGQLLHALHYAHSITSYDGSPLGVVHRDVSPQNVLISNHGEVKLTDFGVAHHAMEESSGVHVKGKVRYMAPEQLAGQSHAPTVDLYAVGALLHELLDGRRFRDAVEDGQMFAMVLSGEIAPLCRPVPRELDELRVSLLAPNPDDRVQSAAQAVRMLKRYPGYGDARDELTKLCGSLTGIMRPRVGPGQSGQVPMADRFTTRYKPNLAKPIVVPAAEPSRILSAATDVSIRTTMPIKANEFAKTPLEGSAAWPSALPAMITGNTAFVEPQVGPLDAQRAVPSPAASSSAPQQSPTRPEAPPPQCAPFSTPSQLQSSPDPAAAEVQTSSLLSAGVDALSSMPVPVSVPAQSSNLAPAGVDAQPSMPIPTGVPPQPSNPAPASVGAQSSYPISTDRDAQSSYSNGVRLGGPLALPPTSGQPVTPGAIPKTERPRGSLVPNPQVAPASSEGLDVRELEFRDPSGTEREIVPMAALSEGTDTAQDMFPRTMPQQSAVRPVVPEPSALAVLSAVLVVVAMLSVAVAWYLFAYDRNDVPKAAELESDDFDPAENRSRAEVEPELHKALQVRESDEPDQGLREAGPPSASTDNPDRTEVPAPLVNARDPIPPPDEQASPQPTPPRSQPVRTWVTVEANPGLTNAQLRIGSQIINVGAMRYKRTKVKIGRKSLKWRPDPKAAWKFSGMAQLKEGRPAHFMITKKGAKKISG